MTQLLSSQEMAQKVAQRVPGSVITADESGLLVKSESLLAVAAFLKDTPELDFNYLSAVTGTDYYDYFEVVYLLISLTHNHRLVLKARCHGRDRLSLPSLVGLWQGASFQEREIHDLLGISFDGHPNMKPLVLWEGFEGHPLRKDFLRW
ncbi:MAG: NADH-quinone oxidoreductase subunit C [Chloroflexota bacterium]